MITDKNLKAVLEFYEFKEKNERYSYFFDELECELVVDFNKRLLIYPEEKGFVVNSRQTCNFAANRFVNNRGQGQRKNSLAF